MKFQSILLLSVLSFSQAWGWGAIGHRVVGQIAEERLTPTAKKRIQGIIGHESLAEASTWADSVRSDPKYKKYDPWHFVEIPDGMTYHNAPKNPEGDVISAIEAVRAVLTGQSRKLTKKEALRYLVHFIGDLHQPLHVGNGLDRGGNHCVVKYAGRNTNLHAVWDSGLIQSRELSFSELSQFLDRPDYITPSKTQSWSAGTVIDWAHESMALRDRVYPPENALEENQTSAGRNYCRAGETVPNPLIPLLGYPYEYEHKDLLNEQMAKAGVRLARELNELFK